MAKLSERIEEQQARRTRRPLPPSHPRRVSADAVLEGPTTTSEQPSEVIDLRPADAASTQIPVGAPAAALESTGGSARPVSADVAGKPTANRAGVSRPRTARRNADQERAVVPLEPRQVWLDQPNDLWLSECEYANVRRGGRKVLSRSAVVRLALDQLRERLTPEQITDLLADREPPQGGRGRPRR